MGLYRGALCMVYFKEKLGELPEPSSKSQAEGYTSERVAAAIQPSLSGTQQRARTWISCISLIISAKKHLIATPLTTLRVQVSNSRNIYYLSKTYTTIIIVRPKPEILNPQILRGQLLSTWTFRVGFPWFRV